MCLASGLQDVDAPEAGSGNLRVARGFALVEQRALQVVKAQGRGGAYAFDADDAASRVDAYLFCLHRDDVGVGGCGEGYGLADAGTVCGCGFHRHLAARGIVFQAYGAVLCDGGQRFTLRNAPLYVFERGAHRQYNRLQVKLRLFLV